jgi:hypothetical protein
MASDISILSINLGTPIKNIYKIFNLSRKKLEPKGEYLYLEVVPGLKLRITRQLFSTKINAFMITSEFQNRLVGHFSTLFDLIETKDQFYHTIESYFSSPDQYDSTPLVAGFETNRMIYNSGFMFTRFQTPRSSSLTIMISA